MLWRCCHYINPDYTLSIIALLKNALFHDGGCHPTILHRHSRDKIDRIQAINLVSTDNA